MRTLTNVDRLLVRKREFVKDAALVAAALTAKYGLSQTGIDFPSNPIYAPSEIARMALKKVGINLPEMDPEKAFRHLFPYVYAQETEMSEIDVGLAKVPVQFDGQISQGEYSDTIDYQFTPIPKHTPDNVDLEGHMYTKQDKWTYFGFDFTNDKVETDNRVLELAFDTQNTGKQDRNTPGVYTLEITFRNPQSPAETEPNFNIGASFINAFSRGRDYDWRYYFGPSPLNSKPHTQLEVEILTDILTKYSKQIGLQAAYGYFDKNLIGIINSANTAWTPLVFEDIPLPEPGVLALIAGVATAVYVTKRANQKKLSRRELFGLPPHSLVKEK